MEKYKHLPKLPRYKIGDLILVYDPTTPPGTNAKLMRRWTGPYVVIRRISAVNYEVKAINPISNRVKSIKKVHVYRMRLYKPRTDTNTDINPSHQVSNSTDNPTQADNGNKNSDSNSSDNDSKNNDQ
jgi:hypothetical protein